MTKKSIFDQLKGPYSVVVLDDEEGVAEVIEMYLDDHFGDELIIKAFSDSETAFEFIKEHRPHILVTDVRMPKISGDSLVHYCLDLFPNMQIVVTTGDPSLTVKTNCYLDGAAGLIFKPIGPDAIVAMVQVCIDYFKRWEKIILNKK